MSYNNTAVREDEGDEEDEGEITNPNYQLPITNYQLPKIHLSLTEPYTRYVSLYVYN
ncbi:hypothetical protein NIES37_41980 [Tolypothrix tenuis PCC 7101]|uniref:Uncharacterized protein n=1 Tax=Tolypothrix tenuis PCC 7101 TaxID=231146 RepID=A0A1Z4N3A9_9CYAN|nr:hypothetical protein NIES37_41980 [Tolypothrix tenuis PCC 7101]BAZ75870.1 hypothetical protein NIES50_44610 [Aulosira laxa NIES-50]